MAYTYYYSSLSVSLSSSVGANEDLSLQNFQQWLDLFALQHCNHDCLVKDLNGHRTYGLFDHMRKGEHDDFEAHMTNFGPWATQCQNANISAGKYFAVAPSGRGETKFTHKKLGPFQ